MLLILRQRKNTHLSLEGAWCIFVDFFILISCKKVYFHYIWWVFPVMYPFVLCVRIYVIYMICSFNRCISFYGLLSLGLHGCARKYSHEILPCVWRVDQWSGLPDTKDFVHLPCKIIAFLHTHTYTKKGEKKNPVSLHLVRYYRTNILETWSPYAAEMNSTSN